MGKDIDRCWQSFLRRFDLEHTLRLFKQTLGWAKPQAQCLPCSIIKASAAGAAWGMPG